MAAERFAKLVEIFQSDPVRRAATGIIKARHPRSVACADALEKLFAPVAWLEYRATVGQRMTILWSAISADVESPFQPLHRDLSADEMQPVAAVHYVIACRQSLAKGLWSMSISDHAFGSNATALSRH